MRRSLIISLLIAAACAKSETPVTDSAAPAAATPAPTAADFAGTWEGKGMPMGKDTVVATFTMTSTATDSGWSIAFPSGEKPAVRVLSRGGDSVVSEAGPYKSVTRPGQMVTTHSIMHLRGGMLEGMTHSKFSNGDTATFRITATRKP